MAHQDQAPILSTPAAYVPDERYDCSHAGTSSIVSKEQLYITYEIERTIKEIRNQNYKKIALQFPDGMLPDAPRIFDALKNGLKELTSDTSSGGSRSLTITGKDSADHVEGAVQNAEVLDTKFFILGDTSYGACCVDEIAAEHVDADVIVHYGRSCLSPPARIPVIHVFTVQLLPDPARLFRAFQEIHEDFQEKIILMADVTYQKTLRPVAEHLRQCGYLNLHVAEIVHDPSSRLPNRTVPEELTSAPSKLKDWQLFHISDPPESLLLTLSSRLKQIYIYPASGHLSEAQSKPVLISTHRALSRRYALLTSVNTVSIFGILINTLSVKNYLHIVDHVKTQISDAGKKSYTFVVGKVNAAKVANFGEIGAWVVIGCWESSLIDSKDFWRPVLTPFELKLALMSDTERVWTGNWSSDFQEVLDQKNSQSEAYISAQNEDTFPDPLEATGDGDCESEQESSPPEFDLRTGRYVSNTRPMQPIIDNTNPNEANTSHALARRIKGELATVGGDVSPAAEYLRSKPTWTGLGSDFDIEYEDTNPTIHEGTKGIARGYNYGHDGVRI